MIGDASVLTEKYDTSTSVMSLQFIEDIDTCIEKLCTHCRQYILFAVFNPKWVEECLSSKKGSFPDRENWVSQGVSLPVFHRSKKEYDNMFQANGFLNVFEEYPSFTSEFVEQYSWDRPSNVSEFMILGYQKEMH